jgi:hypothetical protein
MSKSKFQKTLQSVQEFESTSSATKNPLRPAKIGDLPTWKVIQQQGNRAIIAERTARMKQAEDLAQQADSDFWTAIEL